MRRIPLWVNIIWGMMFFPIQSAFYFTQIYVIERHGEKEKRGNKYSAFLTMSRLFITNFSSSKNKKNSRNVFCDYCLIFFFIIYFSVSLTFPSLGWMRCVFILFAISFSRKARNVVYIYRKDVSNNNRWWIRFMLPNCFMTCCRNTQMWRSEGARETKGIYTFLFCE